MRETPSRPRGKGAPPSMRHTTQRAHKLAKSVLARGACGDSMRRLACKTLGLEPNSELEIQRRF